MVWPFLVMAVHLYSFSYCATVRRWRSIAFASSKEDYTGIMQGQGELLTQAATYVLTLGLGLPHLRTRNQYEPRRIHSKVRRR